MFVVLKENHTEKRLSCWFWGGGVKMTHPFWFSHALFLPTSGILGILILFPTIMEVRSGLKRE